MLVSQRQAVQLHRANVLLLMVVLGLAACTSRPVLKKPDSSAIATPINTPEAAAKLKQEHAR